MGTGGAAGGKHFNDHSAAEQTDKDSISSPRMSSIAPSNTGNNNNHGLNFGSPTWRAAPSEIGTDISEPMSIHSQRTQPWVVEQLFVAGARAILGETNPADSDETKDKDENMASRGLMPEGGDTSTTPFYNRSPSYNR